MTTIAIDCDEVLSKTLDTVLDFHNYQFKGEPITKDIMTSYYLFEMEQYDADPASNLEFFAPVLSGEMHEEIEPVEGALEKLQQRKKDGHKMIVVTGRPSMRKASTEKRINTHYPDIFEDIYFAEHLTEHSKLKSEICKEIGATVMIEDNLDYSTDTASHGIKSFLIDYPWNRAYDENDPKYDGIIKVKGRDEIEL